MISASFFFKDGTGNVVAFGSEVPGPLAPSTQVPWSYLECKILSVG